MRPLKISYQLLLLVLLIGSPAGAMAQVCDVSDVIFRSQAEIDDFQSTYGPCTEISGDLNVSGLPLFTTDITSFAAFNDITRVGGTLRLQNHLELPGLDGFTSLTEIAGDLLISNIYYAEHIDGLANLTTVHGHILLSLVQNLENIDGLSGLSYVGDGLSIDRARTVTTLAPLLGLNGVNGTLLIDGVGISNLLGLGNMDSPEMAIFIKNCPQLTSLDGFPQGLDYMGHDLTISNNPALNDVEALSNLLVLVDLDIRDNDDLQQLTGLDNIQAVEGSLRVFRNPRLADCTSILSLVDDVDDFGPGPGPGVSGVPDVRDEVYLQDNQSTCNSEYLVEGFIFESGFE